MYSCPETLASLGIICAQYSGPPAHNDRALYHIGGFKGARIGPEIGPEINVSFLGVGMLARIDFSDLITVLQTRLTTLLEELQPNSVMFEGFQWAIDDHGGLLKPLENIIALLCY